MQQQKTLPEKASFVSWRKLLNLDYLTISKETGLAPYTIFRLETGLNKPRPSTKSDICQCFNKYLAAGQFGIVLTPEQILFEEKYVLAKTGKLKNRPTVKLEELE
jgi:DNA-binding XRE family transcriptional regulator